MEESNSCNCRVRNSASSDLSMNNVCEYSIIPAFLVFPEAHLGDAILKTKLAG